MPPQEKRTPNPQEPSKRRLEELAEIWARQTGRKIIVA